MLPSCVVKWPTLASVAAKDDDLQAFLEPTAGLEPATPSLRGSDPPTHGFGFTPPLPSSHSA